MIQRESTPPGPCRRGARACLAPGVRLVSSRKRWRGLRRGETPRDMIFTSKNLFCPTVVTIRATAIILPIVAPALLFLVISHRLLLGGLFRAVFSVYDGARRIKSREVCLWVHFIGGVTLVEAGGHHGRTRDHKDDGKYRTYNTAKLS